VTALPYIDGESLMSLVSWTDATLAIEQAIAAGGTGVDRASVPTAHGELLLMPAESAAAVGVKLVGVAPANPEAGLPRIQAVYVLFDAVTMTPRALIDGTALTTLRTPAVSALAVRHLAAPGASSLVVFGSGPQAWGHAHALRAVRPLRTVTVVGRDQDRARHLVDRLNADGFTATTGTAEAVADAELVVTATSARTPLFDGGLLADGVCVTAVGSHEPAARELDDAVFRRASYVVVEDAATALREAGDVIHAVASGALDADRLTGLADLGSIVPSGGITVFKSVGMGHEDLAVAEAAYTAWRRRSPVTR
jgi:ornithine cyclodeaminase/alanine dehydrogenase-like protein (mu-crystallin family)